MKKTLLLLSGIAMLAFTSFSQSRTLNVFENGGTLTQYDLLDIHKITFSGNEMIINDFHGQISYPMLSIGKLTFVDIPVLALADQVSVELGAFPNPVQNEGITLNVKSSFKGSGQLRVVSLSGESVYSSELTLGNSNIFQIPTNTLSTGIYLVEVIAGNNISTYKIFKN